MPTFFWVGELAALAIALFSAIRQYKKNQNGTKLQTASMQAEQLRKLREQEAMEAQMQQKKRLADQMLTEWKDSLREKENRLFNLEEEITRQSVQSWQSTKERRYSGIGACGAGDHKNFPIFLRGYAG